MVSAVGGERSRGHGGTQPGKGNIKNRSLSVFLFCFLQVLKQMTRNVTGFLFILEIKMTIRWRECGGVGDGGGVRRVKWFIV